MISVEKYNKAIKHIKNTGLLTDPLHMTQVRNAIHIAAFGYPFNKKSTTLIRDVTMDRIEKFNAK